MWFPEPITQDKFIPGNVFYWFSTKAFEHNIEPGDPWLLLSKQNSGFSFIHSSSSTKKTTFDPPRHVAGWTKEQPELCVQLDGFFSMGPSSKLYEMFYRVEWSFINQTTVDQETKGKYNLATINKGTKFKLTYVNTQRGSLEGRFIHNNKLFRVGILDPRNGEARFCFDYKRGMINQ